MGTGGIIFTAYVVGAMLSAFICGLIVRDDFISCVPIMLWPLYAIYAPFWLCIKAGQWLRDRL